MHEVTRTELVWPGKYDANGEPPKVDRVPLPFRVIERVNGSVANENTWAEGWRNKLIWGDNRLVMSSLLEEFAGGIDLVYIDPPFAVGADFSVVAEIGDDEVERVNSRSSIENKAYRDTWGPGLESYLTMLYERLLLVRELLADTGLVFVHLDWHVGHYGKILLDEVFGPSRFLNEIVRLYAGGGQSKDFFPRKHEPIFLYTAGTPGCSTRTTCASRTTATTSPPCSRAKDLERPEKRIDLTRPERSPRTGGSSIARMAAKSSGTQPRNPRACSSES